MEITVQELKQKLDNSENVMLIDVREAYEHDEFNIGGTLMPLGTVPLNLEDWEDRKEENIVLYCRSGNRSGMAQQLFQQAGFKNVLNLTGGMIAWSENINH